MKQSLKKTATVAGTTVLTATALPFMTPSAHAAGKYSIVIDTHPSANSARYCLLTTTSDRKHANACASLDGRERAALSVEYTSGDRVWIDIHYQEAGRSDLGIALQGKRYIRVADHFHSYDPPVSYNKVCGWKNFASHDVGNPGLGLLTDRFRMIHGAGGGR